MVPPEACEEFVAPMEYVLDLYEASYDRARPTVCFDESPKQLIGEVRAPIPPRPGTPARKDTKYRRNGVGDLMIWESKRGWREVLALVASHQDRFRSQHATHHQLPPRRERH